MIDFKKYQFFYGFNSMNAYLRPLVIRNSNVNIRFTVPFRFFPKSFFFCPMVALLRRHETGGHR